MINTVNIAQILGKRKIGYVSYSTNGGKHLVHLQSGYKDGSITFKKTEKMIHRLGYEIKAEVWKSNCIPDNILLCDGTFRPKHITGKKRKLPVKLNEFRSEDISHIKPEDFNNCLKEFCTNHDMESVLSDFACMDLSFIDDMSGYMFGKKILILAEFSGLLYSNKSNYISVEKRGCNFKLITGTIKQEFKDSVDMVHVIMNIKDKFIETYNILVTGEKSNSHTDDVMRNFISHWDDFISDKQCRIGMNAIKSKILYARTMPRT